MFQSIRSLFAPDPENTTFLETVDKAREEPKEFLASMVFHLDALRKHLTRGTIMLALTSAIAFFFMAEILEWLALPAGGLDQLIAIKVTEPISVVMKVALLVGFTISLPYISFEILLFLSPALYRRSRMIGLLGLPFITIFFLGGIAFTYYVMLSPALDVLIEFMGIRTTPSISSYISFATSIMFWIGISFEFPIVAYILSAMGILNAKVLRNQWRIAFVVLAIMAAMITPTVDPINMSIVLVPLWTLYGLSIIMASFGSRARRKRE